VAQSSVGLMLAAHHRRGKPSLTCDQTGPNRRKPAPKIKRGQLTGDPPEMTLARREAGVRGTHQRMGKLSDLAALQRYASAITGQSRPSAQQVHAPAQYLNPA